MSHADWVRALALTAPIAKQMDRTLPVVIDELATEHADRPALLADVEQLSFCRFAARARAYARWALDQGVQVGERVALLMPNRPEYLAAWLGITRVGGVAALLNTHLRGPALAHCLAAATPRQVIVDAALLDRLTSDVMVAVPEASLWSYGTNDRGLPDVGHIIDATEGRSTSTPVHAHISDPALLIYTSGTTGLPKAAIVSHYRVMQWSYWFAGLADLQPDDRMYDCLPLYHSVGGVVAIGATLVAGGAVVIRDGFSASAFWKDIRRWECTTFQYIGELCRYLLHGSSPEQARGHRLRLACGNGLGADIYSAFRDRFAIPRILEFYAATEGTVSLFNVDGQPGSIGRVPPYLAQRFPVALVRIDIDQATPQRSAAGLCERCETGEIGEAIGRLGSGGLEHRFEGYTDTAAGERKILRDVFARGDAWYRTGDLMRKDAQGYFYFVDRIGDTFRWKGENVATSEVAAALTNFCGVLDASVYGVAIPGTDGRAGMATIRADGALDLNALHDHLEAALPHYARPLFLRVTGSLALTTTFKHAKADLVRAGFDPRQSTDPIYFDNARIRQYVRVDDELHRRLCEGGMRL